MHCIKADYPVDWPICNVYILSDWHIGDKNSERELIEKQIQTIQDDPYGLCILNGDLLNSAVRNSVSDVYGETIKPMEQLIELVTLLKPIKKKIIGADIGNHEYRIYKNDGIDVMRLVCRELGIEKRYCPEGILVFLRFGTSSSHGRHIKTSPRQLFTIYATHGAGGGRKEGAKAIRLADMAAIVDADVYIHSHTHLPMIMKEKFYRTSMCASSAKKVTKLFVNSSAALDYGGYGQTNEYKPNSTDNPVIHLEARTGKATATL